MDQALIYLTCRTACPCETGNVSEELLGRLVVEFPFSEQREQTFE
jgi:hypothetical protein